MDEIANIVAAGLSGRGSKDYANTYLNLRKAKGASDARTELHGHRIYQRK